MLNAKRLSTSGVFFSNGQIRTYSCMLAALNGSGSYKRIILFDKRNKVISGLKNLCVLTSILVTPNK